MASKLYSPAQPHKFELLAGELCGRTQQTSVCGWQAFCKGLANISPLDGKLMPSKLWQIVSMNKSLYLLLSSIPPNRNTEPMGTSKPGFPYKRNTEPMGGCQGHVFR